VLRDFLVMCRRGHLGHKDLRRLYVRCVAVGSGCCSVKTARSVFLLYTRYTPVLSHRKRLLNLMETHLVGLSPVNPNEAASCASRPHLADIIVFTASRCNRIAVTPWLLVSRDPRALHASVNLGQHMALDLCDPCC